MAYAYRIDIFGLCVSSCVQVVRCYCVWVVYAELICSGSMYIGVVVFRLCNERLSSSKLCGRCWCIRVVCIELVFWVWESSCLIGFCAPRCVWVDVYRVVFELCIPSCCCVRVEGIELISPCFLYRLVFEY
ncbi:hypothetical protein CEXT_674321 [Caerostris extrusa]|uniref:Transmembrane protein n=1 Tax=Caerostris extrusa TaxID=172846 RepID=A0AAV4VQQ4_CAEEX|nr:hypothetical protein CEXT_674321 [Caerostris extrusa]